MLTSTVHHIKFDGRIASPRLADPKDETCAPLAFISTDNAAKAKAHPSATAIRL